MFILNIFHQIVGWTSIVNFGGVKFLDQGLYLKVFILNVFHQIVGWTSNVNFRRMIFLFKDSTWKCSFWTFFIKLWVGPQMWILADWNFLFKDSTWKCSFWTFFIKLWVGPQMWILADWNFLFKDSTWKCSFWTCFIKLWVGPQMWASEEWNFFIKYSAWKCSFWTFFHQILGRTSMGTSSYTSPYSWYTLGSNFEFYKLFRHVHGVFDKGILFGTNSFYIYVYTWCFPASSAGSQRCWLYIKKEYIYIYIYLHLDETSLWKGGVKFLYQILCLKVFILNIFHQILGRTSMGTSSYTSPYSWYTLGSNFEFYKLIRHVDGVFS